MECQILTAVVDDGRLNVFMPKRKIQFVKTASSPGSLVPAPWERTGSCMKETCGQKFCGVATSEPGLVVKRKKKKKKTLADSAVRLAVRHRVGAAGRAPDRAVGRADLRGAVTLQRFRTLLRAGR